MIPFLVGCSGLTLLHISSQSSDSVVTTTQVTPTAMMDVNMTDPLQIV